MLHRASLAVPLVTLLSLINLSDGSGRTNSRGLLLDPSADAPLIQVKPWIATKLHRDVRSGLDCHDATLDFL